MERVLSRAHASTANLASGYDIVAVSLDLFYDTVEIQKNKGTGKLSIKSEGGIPLNPEENSAGIPVVRLMKDYSIKDDISITVSKGIPVSSGLGGSGASAVASVAAMNEVYSLELDAEAMIRYASLGEKASGDVHFDNVSASVCGNLTLVVNEFPVKVVRLSMPEDIGFVLILPNGRFKSNTEEMRRLLPPEVSLRDHIENSRYLLSLIHGITSGDRESIIYGLDDIIVEPARTVRYPYFTPIRQIARENNALGAYISGSGPSVAIMTDSETDLNKLKSSVEKSMAKVGIPCRIYSTGVGGGFHVE